MANRLLGLVALLALMVVSAAGQDARSVLQAAATAMGATNLKSVQYSGTGWNAAVGQSYSANDDWPRFEVTSYTRSLDYDARSSREQLTRRQGNYPPRGSAIQGEQQQISIVSGNYAWNVQGNATTPQPVVRNVRIDVRSL